MLASFERGCHGKHELSHFLRRGQKPALHHRHAHGAAASASNTDPNLVLDVHDVTHFAPLHADAISCVRLLPPAHASQSISSAALPPLREDKHAAGHADHQGKYVTCCLDGTVAIWHADGTVSRRMHLDAPLGYPGRQTTPWLSDLVVLPRFRRAVACFMNRTLAVIDTSALQWRIECEVVQLPSSVMTIDYATCTDSFLASWLVLGDESGAVHTLQLTESAGDSFTFESFYHDATHASHSGIRKKHTLSSRGTVREGRLVMTFSEFVDSPHITHRRFDAHKDWCRKVRCGPTLGSFLSCASNTESSLVLYDPGTARDDKLRTFSLHKGVCTFDYDMALSVVVTGARHGVVNVWNPHITSTCFAHLRGHNAMIVGICIRNIRGGQIISVSEDGVLIVWDLASHERLQTLTTRHDLQHPPVSAVLFHGLARRILLCTSAVLAIGLVGHTDVVALARRTHDSRVVAARFNPLFNEIVSCDENGTVKVFNVLTGEAMVQFSGVHGPHKVTWIGFDASLRRLMTAAGNGTVKVWNFNIGLSLFKLTGVSRNEVAGAAQLSNNAILTAGWFRHVCLFRQRPLTYTVKPAMVYDNLGLDDDVLCMALNNFVNMLALASSDGSVNVYRADTMTHFQKMKIELGLPDLSLSLFSHVLFRRSRRCN